MATQPHAPISTAHVVRGIYAREDEAATFLRDGIPLFDTAEQCQAFLEAHCQSTQPPSNPERPHMTQLLTTLVNWGQVESYLLAARREYDARWPPRAFAGADDRNVWTTGAEAACCAEELEARLELPVHKRLTPDASVRSLKYLFEHTRSGIFVKIAQNKVCLFAPFVNEDYANHWGDALELEDGKSVEKYYKEKQASGMRKEHVLPDKKSWWANGNIICNEHSSAGMPKELSQLWGDRFVSSLRDMLDQTCANRTIGDCEFLVNKRDYPQLKFNEEAGECVEPYGFLVDRDDRDPADDVSLPRPFRDGAMAPICSFYCSARFADLPFPTSEDWEAAIGVIVPPSFDHSVERGALKLDAKPRDLFTEAKFRQFDCDWADKAETAFFRGTATGGGVTVATNQRLALADCGVRWSAENAQRLRKLANPTADESRDLARADASPPLLDAKLTGWNRRDKKVAGTPVTHVRPADFPFDAGRHNFVPIFEQSRYKYLVYVEGHCAACRYGFMMRLGSVILKVESKCVADAMWFFPLLRPFVDHVPVRADLSDLAERIEWCRANDAACEAMAANAKRLYDTYLHKEGLMDYVQLALNGVAQRFSYPPRWLEAPPLPAFAPVLGAPRDLCVNGELCSRCKLDDARDRCPVAASKKAKKAAHSEKPRPERNFSSLADASKKKRAAPEGKDSANAASLRARMKRKKT